MAVNPDKLPVTKYDLAMKFVEWILSPEIQAKIGGYGVDKFGQPLFYPGAPPSTPAPAAAALKMTGPALELSWTEEQLKALGTIDVDYTGKDGTTTTYTGVLITKLLEEAKAPADAIGLVLVASDAYTAALAMADIQGCADCIVAFDPNGGLRSVLPNLSGKAQVKNLVEIYVQGGARPGGRRNPGQRRAQGHRQGGYAHRLDRGSSAGDEDHRRPVHQQGWPDRDLHRCPDHRPAGPGRPRE